MKDIAGLLVFVISIGFRVVALVMFFKWLMKFIHKEEKIFSQSCLFSIALSLIPTFFMLLFSDFFYYTSKILKALLFGD